MNPISWKEVQSLNRDLRSGSWDLFQNLLRNVCQTYAPRYPFAATCYGLIRNKDVDGLVTYADSLSSQKYDDATTHFVANQIASLIRKYPYPKGSNTFDPEAKAISKFMKSEHKCMRVNQRFRAFLKRSPYEQDLAKMRSYIAYVLGDAPNLNAIWQECNFGSGASIGVHGNATNLYRKISAERWSVTPSALLYARGAMKVDPHLFEFLCSRNDGSPFYSHDPELFNKNFDQRLRIVRHNKISFVPKTVMTHRAIAVEPLLNGYLQKGIDVVMRRSLRRAGIDLSDQTINVRLARIGSANHSCNDPLVTIDLSSASDSISVELARCLLPPEWFSLLDSTRSKEYELQGKLYTYHKFCSMGNGFCFPLETLLFVAAAVTCGAKFPQTDFHVYGDDIIVRKSVADKLIPLLKVMGFSTNSDKTFVQGPFRESCGGDYFDGKDVRPFTLDFSLDSLEALFKFLNLTRRNERTSSFFSDMRSIILDRIPHRYRFHRPFVGNADTGIDSELDEFMSSRNAVWDRSLQCWSWRELRSSPIQDFGWRRDVRSGSILMIGLVNGVSSSAPFTMRRMTRTSIHREVHGGPPCNLGGQEVHRIYSYALAGVRPGA